MGNRKKNKKKTGTRETDNNKKQQSLNEMTFKYGIYKLSQKETEKITSEVQ